MTRPELETARAADQEPSRLYVYFNTGAVESFPGSSLLSVQNDTMTLDCGDLTIEYPRSSVYLVSRQPISPPSLF
jgi:hypothetical protein